MMLRSPNPALYVIVAVMLLVAKEDIDGLRVRDRLETVEQRESIEQF